MSYPKKLIEVALPLEAINKESAREKSIRHGHPSTLHLWWARRPLAACRAVLFSSLVDDPSEYIEGEEAQKAERERLFQLIEKLVLWENINNEEVLDEAKLEIARSVARNLGLEMPIGKRAIAEFLATQAPPVLDPFAGGGSIPLEAQRLGLRAYASDLNPVAVLINKALIEIPPKFAGQPPVHPPEEQAQGDMKDMFAGREWKGAEGLAEDVRYYGAWMRAEAEKRIGHLYPKVKVTADLLADRPDLRQQGLKAGDELTVIAWLWARTVACPNPSCGAWMPLVRSFDLSKKKGKQAWVEVEPPEKPLAGKRVRFRVKTGTGRAPKGTVERSGAKCITCGTPVPFDHIRAEGKAGRMEAQLMAVVLNGPKGRLYLKPSIENEELAKSCLPLWKPEQEMYGKSAVNVPLYGLKTFGDLFTNRQLVALTTFSDLVSEARQLALQHARQVGLEGNDNNLEQGGVGAKAYSDAVALYLAFAVSRGADAWSAHASWRNGVEATRSTFSRQALAMVWDFAEANPFSNSSGNWTDACIGWIQKVLEFLPGYPQGVSQQHNAANSFDFVDHALFISTDPPYYDNIAYADLSDFFYVWLRKLLESSYSQIMSTVLVPKADELVATAYRFEGNRDTAKRFFEAGLMRAFENINRKTAAIFPVSVYYAFKQSETEDDDEEGHQGDIVSTGWETMLEALISAGFRIVGTWPMHTERGGRTLSIGTNALASSVVLVCRKNTEGSGNTTRREFLTTLRTETSVSLRQLQQGNIAPVDLAQASVGPGMAVFSRFAAVLEADGSRMSVRTALGLINQVLDEYLAEQEGEYDSDTRWALTWYEQYGHNPAEYGVAESLSKAKNTSVGGLEQAGILEARAGKVRLLRREELAEEWNPNTDKRATVWEACHYLIRALDTEGEQAAATLLKLLGPAAEPARDLAYRLYTICERKSWAQDALGYNMLVVAWPRLKELASKMTATRFEGM